MLPSHIPVTCTRYKLAGSPWFAWSISKLTLSPQPVLVFFYTVGQFSAVLITGVLEVDFL